MNISLVKGALEEALFSSAKRVATSLVIFILLLSIPISIYLINQSLDYQQHASSRFGAKPSGFPSCSWDKPSVSPGDTAELITINYGNNFSDISTVPAPYIQPETGFKKIGKSVTGGMKYELDTPGTEFTASLLDSNNPVVDGKPNIVTSCKITTTGNVANALPSSQTIQEVRRPSPSPVKAVVASPSPAVTGTTSKTASTQSAPPSLDTYNTVVLCIRQDPACTPTVKQTVDFNNDGVVNEFDLNILLRSMPSR